MKETRKPINLKVAVLSTDMKDHTVVAGTFDKVDQTASGTVGSVFIVFLAESDPDGRQGGGQEADFLPEPLQARAGSEGD